jgi:hypothetical protein
VERIASYNSAIEANEAVAFLINSGIPARSIGWNNALAPIGTLRMPRFTVFVNPPDKRRAQELLAEMNRLPVEFEPGWEADAVPDLSCLPPDTKAPCPACGERLPLDAGLTECPACGAAASVMDVLIERYGPEVLEDCYPHVPTAVPEDLLLEANLACPHCSYDLARLPSSGICPECGERYSKDRMLRGL